MIGLGRGLFPNTLLYTFVQSNKKLMGKKDIRRYRFTRLPMMKTRKKNGTQTISKWEPPKPQTTLKKIRWKFPPVNPSVFFKGRILEWLQRLQGGIRHFNAPFLVRRKFVWPSSKQWSTDRHSFSYICTYVYHFVFAFLSENLATFFWACLLFTTFLPLSFFSWLQCLIFHFETYSVTLQIT